MNMKSNPATLPDGTPVPLSPGIEVDGFVILSGQMGLKDGTLVPGGIIEQTHATIDNIEQLLAGMSCSINNVVKSTVWLTDAANFGAFNKVYGGRFPAPYPARSTVISGLVLPGALIEIEVLARKSMS